VTSCDFAIVFATAIFITAEWKMGRAASAPGLVRMRRIDIAAPADPVLARSRSDFFVSLLFSLHLSLTLAKK
jgi:hypothetical protein